MVETKPTDQGDQQLKAQEVKPLASSDAQAIATPSAQDKQIAESDRTNQSSGSLTELALKTRGLSREQVAAQMEAQGDSISIDYGNGQEASRKTGLTEKELVQVGSKTYDAKTIVAYDNQGNSGIVSDATNATAVYETDKSKIVPKQVEVQPTQVNAGLDYNKESLPLSQRLGMFAQSAEARLMDPAARKAYFQGMIDKALGVGVGLNEVKEEIKGSAQMAATRARTALEDGSVATFMAQPNAINEPLFKTIGTCFDAMRKDPNAVNNVLAIMGRELETANSKYTNMTPYERGVQDGKAMFFFINPSGSTGRAIEVVDSVAAKVDPLVEKAIQDGMKAAEKLAKESPEYARKAQRMVLDYAREHGLTLKQLETIGVPNEYLEGVSAPKPIEPIKTSDTINAMSKADDLGAEAKAGDIQSGNISDVKNTQSLESESSMKEIRTARELAQAELTKKSVEYKLTTYCLNPSQEMQKHRWFESALGFNLENKEKLAVQIVLDQAKLTPIRIDPWGIMYEQPVTITGANKRVLENCRIFWQQNEKTGLFEFKNLLLPKKWR
jgi:hypothetical protein